MGEAMTDLKKEINTLRYNHLKEVLKSKPKHKCKECNDRIWDKKQYKGLCYNCFQDENANAQCLL